MLYTIELRLSDGTSLGIVKMPFIPRYGESITLDTNKDCQVVHVEYFWLTDLYEGNVSNEEKNRRSNVLLTVKEI